MARCPTYHLLLACAVAGCSDLTAPPAYTGSYRILQVNGSTVPAVLPVATSGCATTVLGGRLDLRASSFSFMLSTMLSPSTACPLANSALLDLSGTVQDSASILSLASSSPPEAIAVTAHMRAELDEHGLDLTWLDEQYGLPAGTRFVLTRMPEAP
jgi:hypothetical protein